MKRNLILLMMIIASVISCEKADRSGSLIKNTNGEYAILFRSQSTKAVATTISGNHYDDFSLFTWNSNGDLVMNPYLVKASGVGEYQYDEVDGQELKYFKRAADNYYFLGIIPSDHTMSKSGDEVTVEDLVSFTVDDNKASGTIEADSKEEFLFGSTTVSRENYGNQVVLQLNHGNALLYLGFSSDRDDTKLLDYTPEIPGTSVAGTLIDKKAKMFDEMASGQLVSYALVPLAGDQNGYYAGFKGNYFNLNPYHGAYNYVSKERLAALMPLVNAQFIYTDENCAYVDKWEYGVNKQYKIFLKFADGVDIDAFAAGNDAFWTNLTTEEKSRMQNHHDSGCRIIRIEELPDGNYFAWGETYGTYINYSGRDLKIMNGGTIGTPAIPAINGVRVFSANLDNSHYIHIPHTTIADAAVSQTGVSYSNRETSSEAITFSLPANTTLSPTAVFSPTTFYAIPGDANLNYFVVKLSYTYNGTTVYDVRVPIKLPDGGLVAGKYYRYTINITSTSDGGTTAPDAVDKKNEIDTTNYPIDVIIQPTQYTEGANEVIVI